MGFSFFRLASSFFTILALSLAIHEYPTERGEYETEACRSRNTEEAAKEAKLSRALGGSMLMQHEELTMSESIKAGDLLEEDE